MRSGLLLVLASLWVTACHPQGDARAPRAPESTPEVARAPETAAPSPVREPPGRHRVVSVTTSIVVLEPIQFIATSASVDPRSSAMLDMVAEMFADHSDLELIEVRASGPLGLVRAESVVRALVARGVAPTRLRAAGDPAAPPDRGPELVIVRRRGDPG